MAGSFQNYHGSKDKKMVDQTSSNLSEIQAQWVTVRGKIRQKIGDAQFASWIKVVNFRGL